MLGKAGVVVMVVVLANRNRFNDQSGSLCCACRAGVGDANACVESIVYGLLCGMTACAFNARRICGEKDWAGF